MYFTPRLLHLTTLTLLNLDQWLWSRHPVPSLLLGLAFAAVWLGGRTKRGRAAAEAP